MEDRVCPPWVGYLLLNPLRKLLENPVKLFGAYVREGMTIIEPGCGMGYFTLPLAEMVGPTGQVVVVDVQSKMLEVVERRARKAGLADRIECRLTNGVSLGIDDLAEKADFCAAMHLVHEVPDQNVFFQDISQALKPGSRFLVVEPRGHVSEDAFDRTLANARSAGFKTLSRKSRWGGRSALLERNGNRTTPA